MNLDRIVFCVFAIGVAFVRYEAIERDADAFQSRLERPFAVYRRRVLRLGEDLPGLI